ncbi:regulatory protein RecX [Trueperella sp. LYQ143]|uniref:regulatory protein RecX n=1 Tax=unclassified Trueperella TaxID=2630174 RepID=UPI003982FBE8
MVDYRLHADAKVRRRASAAEIAARRRERAAQRSEEEWYSFAKDVCYRQLAMMERSVAQLRTALHRQLVPDEIANSVIDMFCQADLVNDERFARMFVRSKFATKTTSRRVLRRELAEKGVSAELVEQALAEISDDSELEAARDFAQRKVRSMRGIDEETIRRRLYGALGRRGFCAEHIRQAIYDAFAGEDGDAC